MAEESKPAGIAWLVSGLLLGAIVGVAAMTMMDRTQPAAIEILPPEPTPTAAPSATPGPLHVYITGAVTNPAVYELPAGSIVADVVDAAGNFDNEAATELINLALPLSDGMHIHVPERAEVELEGVSTPPVVSAVREVSGGAVNINTAGAEELETLPGIGRATAQNIVDYRQANGPFTRIEEIMDVSGIGPAKFEQMKALITVE